MPLTSKVAFADPQNKGFTFIGYNNKNGIKFKFIFKQEFPL